MHSAIARTVQNNLWKMAAIRLLFWTHFFGSVLIPFYRDWGGLSFVAIFLINAWFMVWNVLLEVPTGSVADVFGRRVSLALGGFTAAAGILLLASTPHLAVFLGGELLMAAAFTLMSGADEALVYDSLCDMDRTAVAQRAYARLESFKLAGIVVGVLSGGFLAAWVGVAVTVRVTAIPLAASGLIALTLAEPARHAAHAKTALRDALLAGVRYFAAHGALRALALDMVATAALVSPIVWFYQPALERAGYGLRAYGIVHAAMSLGQIAVLARVEKLENLAGGRSRYLFLAAIVPGISYLVLASAPPRPFVIAAIIAAAAVGLSRAPLFLAQMNAHIPTHLRATVLSTISMSRTAACAIVYPLAGLLADRSLGLALGLLGGAALAVAIAARASEAHLGAEEIIATD